MYRLARILSVICLATSFLCMANAQPRSSGLTFSYSGIGISYQHDIDGENFAEIQRIIDPDQITDLTDCVIGLHQLIGGDGQTVVIEI